MSEFDALIDRAACGDAEAQGDLYRRYAGTVNARIRRRLTPVLRRYFDTGDLSHSVFGEVLREIRRFDNRGERAFLSWVLLKAESKIHQKYRKVLGARGRRHQPLLDAAVSDSVYDGRPGPCERAETSDDVASLARRIAALDPIDAEVLRLHGGEQLPFDVVAARVGLPSADAARKRYARALVRLRGA